MNFWTQGNQNQWNSRRFGKAESEANNRGKGKIRRTGQGTLLTVGGGV